MFQQELHILPLNAPDEEIVPSYAYVCRLLKYGKDYYEDVRRKFVIIRRYNIVNGNTYDTDLYIVQKDILNDYPEKIQWPAFSGPSGQYSSSPVDFNGVWNLQEHDKYDIYINNSGVIQEGAIPCDILRVYHPVSQKSIDAIVDVSTTCGSVNIHLLCQLYENGKTCSTESFDNGNDRYSEYKEFLVPSIDWLTSGKNAYMKEDLANVSTDNEDFVVIQDDEDYLDLVTLKMSFIIDDEAQEDGSIIYNKIWVPRLQEATRENNVVSSLRVCIWPVDANENDDADIEFTKAAKTIWTPSSIYASGTTVFQDDARVSIKARFGFDNGHPAIISEFAWPGIHGIETIDEAYKYFYGVDLLEYIYENDDIEDESDEEVEPQKMCHFDIKIFKDYKMTEEIWHSYVDLNEPDDFAFQLTGIFTDWKQFPELVIMQTRFVDRWLGNIIKSNPVILSDRQLKYLITEWPDGNRINITGTQTQVTHKEDMNLEKVNFIDKVTCVVRKATQDNPAVLAPGKQASKILYKPIFYKTRDLYNIQLHSGITQNIGINLGDYMTKVETFVIKIGNLNVPELGRNESNVIFKINASEISARTGKYYISNQDGDFISAGNYTLI